MLNFICNCLVNDYYLISRIDLNSPNSLFRKKLKLILRIKIEIRILSQSAWENLPGADVIHHFSKFK